MASYGITVNNVGLSFVRDSGMVEGLNEVVVAKMKDRMSLDIFIDLQDVVYCLFFFLNGPDLLRDKPCIHQVYNVARS